VCEDNLTPDGAASGQILATLIQLKGANSATTPIEQATQFERVINLKTAKALGIMFPNSILVRADKVIE
jgi:ABC-type uncharacterized transport system substrate-binding protein